MATKIDVELINEDPKVIKVYPIHSKVSKLVGFKFKKKVLFVGHREEYGEYLYSLRGNGVLSPIADEVIPFQGGTVFKRDDVKFKYYKDSPEKIFIIQGDKEVEPEYVDFDIVEP
ncbi:hypothetical protein ACFL08_03805 [Patescibacteria group bacterium]